MLHRRSRNMEEGFLCRQDEDLRSYILDTVRKFTNHCAATETVINE